MRAFQEGLETPGAQMEQDFLSADLKNLVRSMSNVEKAELLTGFNMWKTHAIPRLGIPNIVMTDGTYGVRYSVEQIDNDEKGGQDLDAFLSVVNQRAIDVESSFGKTKPATCFPNGSSLGCSWDVDLAHELGAAMAQECRALGVQLLLGPGINLRRTPLAGRSYEYYSEDPVVSGDIAAGIINGLQKNGVGASLKHFACNNSEMERTTMDSIVEERALHEIYLLGYERAIKLSNPWTVMSSYNRLNGEQTSESAFLLTEVLRNRWGYDGLIVSDWHGIKDRVSALRAGNDLDMPESETRKASLLKGIEDGAVSQETVDASCVRVLELVRRALPGSKDKGGALKLEEHHDLARRSAAESIVLLKNDNSFLPLTPARLKRVLLVGEGAQAPVIQGSGCATTTPHKVGRPIDEIKCLLGDAVTIDYCVGTSSDTSKQAECAAQALENAGNADAVIVFVNTEVGYDGEGSDRRDLALAPGQDALITALTEHAKNVIVVISSPDAVVMPWLSEVRAVLATFFSGQGFGRAVAGILFGETNPSGKLTVTFPKRIEDIPGYPSYPGECGKHVYSEGIHVGYRYYDKRKIEPLFPFGFGLSYTTFRYDGLRLSSAEIRPGETVEVNFSVTNTGSREGKEVVQLYLDHHTPRLQRSPRILRAFTKVHLQPGEKKDVTLTLTSRDFEAFDPERRLWVLDRDTVTVSVGASSRDIRLQTRINAVPNVPVSRLVRADTQPAMVLDNPIAKRCFVQFIEQKLGISAEEAERVLEYCRHSFLGIFTTLDRRMRLQFSNSEVESLINRINDQMEVADK
jgi:beta-glucosidase